MIRLPEESLQVAERWAFDQAVWILNSEGSERQLVPCSLSAHPRPSLDLGSYAHCDSLAVAVTPLLWLWLWLCCCGCGCGCGSAVVGVAVAVSLWLLLWLWLRGCDSHWLLCPV